MIFIFLKTIKIPSNEEGDVDIMSEEHDQASAMCEQADFARITMRDGTVISAAKHNFNGGRCDCCGVNMFSNGIKFDFYKIA